MTMKLYLAAGGTLGAVLLLAGAYAYGVKAGTASAEANQVRTELAIAKAGEAFALVAATAVSKVRVVNHTSKQVLEREIHIVPDYSACRHSDDGLRAINGALANEPVAPGDSSLPQADPSN